MRLLNKINLKSIPRRQFIFIFIILVFVLMFYPVIMTFNEILARFVIQLDAYKIIKDHLVPWEVRMVGVLLYPFGFQPKVVGEYLAIGGADPLLIEIAWNCIGWQSLLFFLLTAWVGFQGDKYKFFSKIKAWLIGLLGTFIVNLLRIAVVSLLAFYFDQNIAIIFHDYGSTLVIIFWLFLYWWFVYRFVLEEKAFTGSDPIVIRTVTTPRKKV